MWWLICLLLGMAAASDCGVCLHGRCLARTELNTGLKDEFLAGISRTVVDTNNSILYIVRESLQAINLDDNSVKTIPTGETPAYLTVDQVTGDVYYTYGRRSSLYIYRPQINATERINQITSDSMWAYNGTLYWYGLEKELYFIKRSSPKQTVEALKGIRVKSLVSDKFGNIYAGNRYNVYKVKPNGEKTVLASTGYDLIGDKNGEVYMVDPRTFLIYQVDLVTDQFNIVGAFGAKYHRYGSFMFDKHNNIIAKMLLSINEWYNFKDTSELCRTINTDSISVDVEKITK